MASDFFANVHEGSSRRCDSCGERSGNVRCVQQHPTFVFQCRACRFPTSVAMLQLWQMPWSVRRLKFATWALHRARRAGCDVLENPRVMESMEIACATECVS